MTNEQLRELADYFEAWRLHEGKGMTGKAFQGLIESKISDYSVVKNQQSIDPYSQYQPDKAIAKIKALEDENVALRRERDELLNDIEN